MVDSMMRAAVFREVGEALRVEEIPRPRPGPSELIVKVRSCGICGSDLHVAGLPPGLPKGTVMGHEFAGEVAEVGAGVASGFAVGDRVTALPCISCGSCSFCLSGDVMRCPQMRNIGLGQSPGAFAEYIRVGCNETLALPDAVDYRTAALVEPLAVGLHAVKTAQLEAGQDVLILGAGPIGLSVALWARFFGSRSVWVSEPSASRRARAAAFGATAVLDASEQHVAEAFAEQTGAPPSLIFECVGAPGMLARCIGLAAQRGRVVVAGVCLQPDTLLPVLATLKEIQLTFVLAYRKQDFQLSLDMLANGRIHAADMVTRVVDLPGLPAAFEDLSTPGDQCKVLLEP